MYILDNCIIIREKIRLDWDPEKAAINLQKHDVSFFGGGLRIS